MVVRRRERLSRVPFILDSLHGGKMQEEGRPHCYYMEEGINRLFERPGEEAMRVGGE
jgi:hypothetical protein